MVSVLERAEAAEAKSKAEAARAYRDLIAAAVSGTDDVNLDPTPILEAAGKTSADLANDVRHKQKRIEARDRIAAAKAGSKRHATIMASMEESAARLRAEEQRHQQHCWPLQVELRDISQRQIAVMDDERYLRETAPTSLKDEERRLSARLAQAHSQFEEIRGRIQRLEQMKYQASRAITNDDRHTLLKIERDGSQIGSGNAAEVANIQKRLEATTKELRDNEALRADLLCQRDENYRQQLEA